MFDIMPFERNNNRTVFNPFKELNELEKAFFGNNSIAEFKTDIRDTGSAYELEADLPGFKKDELSLELKDGYLVITAAKGLDKDEKEKKSGKYIRRERYAGSMTRSFYVGEDIKQEDIHAKYEDGVLKLTIPKEEKKVPKEEKTYIAIEG